MAESDINNSAPTGGTNAGPAVATAHDAAETAAAAAISHDSDLTPSASVEFEEGINDVQAMINEVNAQFAAGQIELAAPDEASASKDASASPASSLSYSMSSSSSSPTPPAISTAATSPAASTIAAMDQSLAHDIDDLLQGDFESIDAVLKDTYDEPVGAAAMPGAMPIEPAHGKAIHAPVAVVEPLTTAASLQGALGGGKSPSADHALAEDDLSDIATFESLASMDEAAVDAAAPQAESVATSRVPTPVAAAATAEVASPVALPQAVEPDQSKASLAAASAESTGDPSSEIAADEVSSVAKPARSMSAGEALNATLQPLVGLLTLINFPMRLLPANLRPIINWTALTMLAWVPIVWIMLMMGGGNDAAASASPASTTHEGKATKHETPKHEAPKHESSGHGKAASSGHGSGH